MSNSNTDEGRVSTHQMAYYLYLYLEAHPDTEYKTVEELRTRTIPKYCVSLSTEENAVDTKGKANWHNALFNIKNKKDNPNSPIAMGMLSYIGLGIGWAVKFGTYIKEDSAKFERFAKAELNDLDRDGHWTHSEMAETDEALVAFLEKPRNQTATRQAVIAHMVKEKFRVDEIVAASIRLKVKYEVNNQCELWVLRKRAVKTEKQMTAELLTAKKETAPLISPQAKRHVDHIRGAMMGYTKKLRIEIVTEMARRITVGQWDE